MYFLTGIQPSSMFTPGLEDVHFFKKTNASILLQNHADQRHGLARFRRPQDAGARRLGHHGVRGLLAGALGRGEELDLPHSSLCVTSQIRRREAGQRVRERCRQYDIAPGVPALAFGHIESTINWKGRKTTGCDRNDDICHRNDDKLGRLSLAPKSTQLGAVGKPLRIGGFWGSNPGDVKTMTSMTSSAGCPWHPKAPKSILGAADKPGLCDLQDSGARIPAKTKR